MNIRFISSLTPEDEERLAPGILNALGMLLDQVPLAYTLRIETSGGKVFQHGHAAGEDEHAAGQAVTHRAAAAPSLLRPRAPVS